uniref:Uncharacterized protein n=1 Tax=Oryza sativa subsp. japonica TaxID=39947 RepID=Q6Z0B9_ORYSJ|nr:hypothetical protein [Oryza sativa Japonica Group]
MPLGELRRLPFRLLRSFLPLPGRPLARRADAAITVVVVVLPASSFSSFCVPACSFRRFGSPRSQGKEFGRSK